VQEFKKNAFAAITVGIGGVALPLLGGMGLSMLFGFETTVAMYVGVLLVVTSIGISVQTLREMGKLKSREGTTILGAAVLLDDILGVIVLSAVLGLTVGESAGTGGIGHLVFLIIKIAFFLIIAALIGYLFCQCCLNFFNGFKFLKHC